MRAKHSTRSLYGIIGITVAVTGLLCAAHAMIGCDNTTTTDNECFNLHRVSGVVRDSASGMPIDSASVCLQDTSGVLAYTDSLGQYHVEGFSCELRVYARKPGYVTQHRIFAGVQGDLSNVDFELVQQ